jgi:transposase
MMIIGCDFHPRFQQISFLLEETGECGQRRLMHTAEAEQYYRSLGEAKVRVGIEATGSYGWFRRLLSELGHELLVWRCNPDSRLEPAPSEDRQAGCGSY